MRGEFGKVRWPAALRWMPSNQERAIYIGEDRVGAMFRPSRTARQHLRLGISDHDATAYISHVMRQPWFTARFPGAEPVTVQVGQDRYSWTKPDQDRVIHLGVSSLRTPQATEWDLLHELAHILTSAPDGLARVTRLEGGGARQRHGDTWQDTYIFLVQKVVGNRAARRLEAAIRPGPRP